MVALEIPRIDSIAAVFAALGLLNIAQANRVIQRGLGAISLWVTLAPFTNPLFRTTGVSFAFLSSALF